MCERRQVQGEDMADDGTEIEAASVSGGSGSQCDNIRTFHNIS